MKGRALIVLLVLALAANILACNAFGGQVTGSGRVVTTEIDVDSFSGVTLAAFGTLVIEVGAEEELRIEVDDNLVSYFEATVDNRMLTIALQEGVQLEPSDDVSFYLTVEELDTIVLSGAGEIESAALNTDQFSIELSGAGDVTLDGLTAEGLEVELSGAGSLEIASGYVDEQAVVISGAGDYEAEELQSATASVEISGAGSATVWVTSELSVEGDGAGSVEYAGTPQLSTDGSVSVKPVSE